MLKNWGTNANRVRVGGASLTHTQIFASVTHHEHKTDKRFRRLASLEEGACFFHFGKYGGIPVSFPLYLFPPPLLLLFSSCSPSLSLCSISLLLAKNQQHNRTKQRQPNYNHTVPLSAS